MPIKKKIYLDNAATTYPNNEVLKSYLEISTKYFSNPSSTHLLGQESAHILLRTRQEILKLLKVIDHDLIFTSGASEANNLAIKGYCLANQKRGNHIITSSVEHPSILEVFKSLRDDYGFEVTFLPVDRDGVININDLKNSIKKNTILVSLMAVNNEVGSINPIHKIATLLKDYPKICFHVDAVQSVGKIHLAYDQIDMFTITAHKINGLKGSGALIKRKKILLKPLIDGGGQENNLRSGTNDVAGAYAFLKALKLAIANENAHFEHINNLFLELLYYIKSKPELYELNTNQINNPYILNFSLLTKKASVVVEALSNLGIMVSSTSACHSSHEKGSYVVKAMGKEEKLYNNTIRVSFSYENTIEDVRALINALEKILKGIKSK